jgi:hypothetical protein
MDGIALVLVGFLLGVPTGMLVLVCIMGARRLRARRADPEEGRAHAHRE